MSGFLLSLADWVWLVPLLPLLAAGFIVARVLLGNAAGDAAEGATTKAALVAAVGGLLLLLAVDGGAAFAGAPGYRLTGIWFASGDLAVRIAFLLDSLALTVATLVAFLAVATLRFAALYMHRERDFHRFFLAMCLFVTGDRKSGV